MWFSGRALTYHPKVPGFNLQHHKLKRKEFCQVNIYLVPKINFLLLLPWASLGPPAPCGKSDFPPWQLKDQINQGVNYTDHFPGSHGHEGYRWLHIYAAVVKNSTAAFISMNSFDYMFNRCTEGLHKTLSLLVQIFWLLKSFQWWKKKKCICNMAPAIMNTLVKYKQLGNAWA